MPNPKGTWKFKNFNLCFLNEDICSIYGIISPQLRMGSNELMWYWEARTGLDTRIDSDEYPSGWAYSEEEAKEIVETILYNTRTVSKE